jgi:MoxR-like ATPase
MLEEAGHDRRAKPLEEPFRCCDQNPIEHERPIRYRAQLDRFMLKVRVGYPSRRRKKSCSG